MADQFYKAIFPNVHEVVRRALPWEKLPAHFLHKLCASGMSYAELGLLWGGDNKVVVLPREVPTCQIEYIKELLGYKQIKTLTVESKVGLTCQWSSDLENIFSGDLGKVDAGNKIQLSFLFWGASPEAYVLLEHCESLGIWGKSPDLPAKNYYSSAIIFDSKSRFRKVLNTAEIGLDIPEYNVASSVTEVIDILNINIEKRIPCVVKSEFGVGGYGNVFFTSQLLAEGLASCILRLEKAIDFAPYIALGDIVVEHLVSPSQFSGVGTVCGLAQIHPNGTCLMNGVVHEIRVGDLYRGAQTFPGDLAEKIAQETLKIGRLMASKGYRGFFGVDCLVNSEGRLVLLEINARRCSSHFIFEVAKRIFQDTCFSALHNLDLPVTISKPHSRLIEDVVDVFSNLTQNSWDFYAIPTQVTGLESPSPYIGFVLLAGDDISLELSYRRLISDLEKKGIMLGEVT